MELTPAHPFLTWMLPLLLAALAFAAVVFAALCLPFLIERQAILTERQAQEEEAARHRAAQKMQAFRESGSERTQMMDAADLWRPNNCRPNNCRPKNGRPGK